MDKDQLKSFMRASLGGLCDGFVDDGGGDLETFVRTLQEVTEEFRAELRPAPSQN